MIGNELTEDFIKNKFPESDDVKSKQEPILDVHDFDMLIDKYQSATIEGTHDQRIEARIALKVAYRKALQAAGLDK